ncbi:hypothetical protein GCM10022225_58820 [Plantactinospora mayteni]|uniref:Secreted protein n=1 Tax=Plantactinospora mayteni TaxID=566021 RepID=A0ABQ4EM39_9ACTN|nr:hypothetical protein [Plantactinospora mayteni]GIG95267.1 hypothetical protein Pma05_18400 [Plantactinospora mayteni]
MRLKKAMILGALAGALTMASLVITAPASAAEAPDDTRGTAITTGLPTAPTPSPTRVDSLPAEGPSVLIGSRPCWLAYVDDVWIAYGAGTIFDCQAFSGSGFDPAHIAGVHSVSTGVWSCIIYFTQPDGSLWSYDLPAGGNFKLPYINMVGITIR